MAAISVTPSEVAAALRHFRDHLDSMSEEQQAQFRDRLRAYLEGRLDGAVWREIVKALGKAKRDRDFAYDYNGW
ncbi:hypothetical protein [Bosea sp. NBC_00550]|uniref:hypothetical protein n=1 Tax=Bosea sp. NBC_00550 TaxID=2969621 RepID=UPI0022310D57|nr:hypothetical protein [Bosea sp. NBC_00550]UZF93018.1 hypothetical protein NWE53_02030 [Bosea sp. NBC_00550]